MSRYSGTSGSTRSFCGGQDLCNAFMEVLHQSEGRAIQRFASINKSSRRRRRFCRKHSDGFERLERQCRHYRTLVESLT